MRSHLPQARYAAMTETLNSQLTLSDTMITTDMVEKLVEHLSPEARFKHIREERFHDIDDLDEVMLYLSQAETTQC